MKIINNIIIICISPIQICLLYLNELPLRKVFIMIDGKTLGPNLYSGEIGKQLDNFENTDIILFEPIAISEGFETQLQELTDISSNQRYLRDIILGISDGYIHDRLKTRSPGKLGYARWLTTANRILRVYVSTSIPSTNMIKLVKFIIYVYASSWFGIRSKPIFTKSPIQIFKMLRAVRDLGIPEITRECDAIIKRNAFSLHPESILCCMLVDSRLMIRHEAVKRILRARINNETGIREFNLSNYKFNLDADDYYMLTEYDEDTWLESVLTKHISTELLKSHTPSASPKFTFKQYPSHTQSVERVIRIVSQTAIMSCNPEMRDGRIRSTILARELMPKRYDSKKDFHFC